MNNCPFFFFNTKTKIIRTAFIKNTAPHLLTKAQLCVIFLLSDGRSVFLSNTGIKETVLYSLNFSDDVAGTSYSQSKLKLNVEICMKFSVQKGHRVGQGC